MLIKPAHINAEGIKTVLNFSEYPERTGAEEWTLPWYDSFSQIYIPGISLPGINRLTRPFNVPLLGDAEPISLLIDWPRCNSEADKRVTLTGMLPAEEITRGVPRNKPLKIDEEDTVKVQPKVDRAFDAFIGEWGGFLRVVVTRQVLLQSTGYGYADTGEAEFIVIETEEEFDGIVALREESNAGAGQIVDAIKLFNLSPGIGAVALEQQSD